MKFLRLFFLICLILCVMSAVSCSRECSHENMVESINDPTCTQSGNITYSCSDCDYFYVSEIKSPTGHSFEKTSYSATCTTDGYTEYVCECGESFTSDYTSAWGHKFQDTVTAPDCNNGGYTTHKCNTCGYSLTDSFTSPEGHDFEKVTTPPTCTEQGFSTYTCDCGETYVSDQVEPTGHTFADNIISEVSCTQRGEISYTCECGYSYSEITAPEGHSFSRLVIMPTLSDMGYTQYECDKCEFEYTGDYRFYSSILQNAYAPSGESLALGIDVSMYNYKTNPDESYIPLDWQAVKTAGVDYVIIKAGSSWRENYTLGGKEATFEQSYADAKAAGLDVGVYFYTYAKTVNQILLDADLLLSILEGKQFEYPIYLDLEDESLQDIPPEQITEMCVKFFTVLQRAGYYTGLYVNNEWLHNKVQTEQALSKFEIWYARYPEPSEDGSLPIWNTESYGQHLGMWQFTDSASIEGIDEMSFDMNFAYKDYPSLIVDGGFNGYESDVKFMDSDKEFVWVIANALTVRSSEDFSSTDNVIGYLGYGQRIQVLERSESYTKVIYKGQVAYISANPIYVSFEGLT